jgi:hypothetical protein
LKHFLILLTFLIVFTGCRENSTTETTKPLEINPVFKSVSAQNEVVKTIVTTTDSEQTPKVTLNPNDILIDLIDTNLDLDSHDEQILIVKDNSVTGSSVRVLVADFDYILNSYSISWESETNSDNIRSFLLNLTDITGDHNLEIVCSGTDLDGKETLNIYRRTHSEGGLVLTFSEIINLKIDGNIEIKEEKRTQAYQTGISGGVSFPIIVTTTDPLSDNILDLIQKTYFWRNPEALYKLISEDKIPGDEIENIKLRELYREDRDYFRTFLKGPWMLSASDSNLSYNNPFVFFDPENEQIVFSERDFQEIYIWKTSSKTLSNTLLITCRNELVPFLDVTLSVRILDLNNISIRFRDNSIRTNRNTENQVWTGNYFKLSTNIQRDLISDFRSNSSESNIPVLSGYYRSDTGDEIFFNTPDYTLKTDDQIINGGFYLFDNGLKIAEFKSLNENNLVQNTQSYKYDYFEELNETEIIRTIILIPGNLTITGFIPSGEHFIRFLQIEQIEINETSE